MDLEGEKLRGERLRSLAHVLEAGETGCQTGQGRGKKLVTEEPNPVGSGRLLSAQILAGPMR